jgi:serine protease Do
MKPALLFLIGMGIFASGVTAQVPAPAAPRASSYMGVMVQEIDSQRAQALKLHEEAGVEITRVEPDSPAERAGLKPGDAILQYNGEHVVGMEQFSRLVRETPVGRDARLEIVRNGSPQTLVVKVAAKRTPAAAPYPGAPTPPMAPMAPYEMRMPDIPRSFMTWRSSALGIECEGLEGQLADYFGVKQGVLVRSVARGSVAERAGIRAGDVITRVDDANVSTPADLSSRIRSIAPGHSASLSLIRDHKETNLSVPIGDEDRMR